MKIGAVVAVMGTTKQSPIDKHIYNNNQSLNVQNTCCKSTILLPDSISAILNL
jgi:hypothetical protein